MIITRTPLRSSFVGGGTDYPEFFRAHGGATLGMSIDKYIYITVSPLTEFFDYNIRISYSKTELCSSVDDIQHPSVRECMRYLGIEGGVEIVAVSDLPARTGLGSSSSFTVGLLHALHAFKGEMVSRHQLAEEAVFVEQQLIKERVGVQDQYTCAIGGLLNLQFNGEERIDAYPMPVSKERIGALSERLMMFYTGLQRSAHEVLGKQIENTVSGAVTSQLKKMKELVAEGVEIISNGRELAAFGELLHRGWELKRGLSDAVSNPFIEDAYERARRAGAVGGKLLGAGSGGFLLVYAEPYNQPAVRQALRDLKEVTFEAENEGSRLIFYRP